MDVLSVLGIKRPPKVQPQEQANVLQQLVQGVRDYDKSNQEMKKQVEKLINKQMPQAVTAKANLGQLLSGLLGYPGELIAGGGQNMYGGQNTGLIDIPGQVKRMVTNTSTPQEVADFQARMPGVAMNTALAATGGGVKQGEGINVRANRVLGGGTILDDISNLTTQGKTGDSALHLPGQNVYARLPANVLDYLKNEHLTIPASPGDIPHLTPVRSLQKAGAVEVSLAQLAGMSNNAKIALTNFLKGGGTPPVTRGTPKGAGEIITVYKGYDRNLPTRGYTTTSKDYAQRFGSKLAKYQIDASRYFDRSKAPKYLKTIGEVDDWIKGQGYDGYKVIREGHPTYISFNLTGSKATDPLAKFKQKENLVKVDPVLQIKKQITARDIQGNKVELPAGEALTPYELKGNKYLLQDGNEYIVNKNQYQNIKGNAVKAEAQPFAPELEQTTETVKGGSPTNGDIAQKMFHKDWGTLSQDERIAVVDYMRQNDVPSSNPTKFNQYTLPGGENYREVLIQAKVDDKNILKQRGWSFEKQPDGTINAINPEGYVWTNYVPGDKRLRGGDLFLSSHWDEPNVLAHVRLNDRTYNGKPVTFIEEIQSDWAREARKKGVDDPNKVIELENNFKQAQKEYNRAQAEFQKWDKWFQDWYSNVYEKAQAKVPKEISGKMSLNDWMKKLNVMGKWESRQSSMTASSRAAEARDRASYALKEYKPTPSNPLLKNWQELAVKRALKDAVDNNSEYLAWTTGEQQAARYDLSKQVESIKWGYSQVDDNYKDLTINPIGGKAINVVLDENNRVYEVMDNAKDWIGKDIRDVIGKDIGAKIASNNTGKLSGEGLKIGGEWASNLYDRQLPNIVEKVTGQKPEMMDMGIGNNEYKYKALLEHPTAETGETFGFYKSLEEAEAYVKNNPGMPKVKIVKIKTNPQMGIKLTPVVKAKVRGEAPPVKQPSGVNPFLMLMGGLGITGMMADKKRKQGILSSYLGM